MTENMLNGLLCVISVLLFMLIILFLIINVDVVDDLSNVAGADASQDINGENNIVFTGFTWNGTSWVSNPGLVNGWDELIESQACDEGIDCPGDLDVVFKKRLDGVIN